MKRGESSQLNIYTIGFTKKSAEVFFTLLRDNEIKTVIDIRLNNKSQLAGFAKGEDLKYFLNEFCNIEYLHDFDLAPTKEIFNEYKDKLIDWQQFEIQFYDLLKNREARELLDKKYNRNFAGVCFLCSEATADQCHRRLVAEYIKQCYPELLIQIIHL